MVALAALVACGGGSSQVAPTPSVPFSTSDLRVGAGAEATTGKVLTVNYTGWLYSAAAADNKGTQFASSTTSGPLSFTLGSGQVIPGWDRGLVGMKVGGLRRLVIPPDLAYGNVANGPIPANSTLVFEVELVGVQ
jgi:FKBP-type peptidyl-prolyl cis-trans isomerase FkpA